MLSMRCIRFDNTPMLINPEKLSYVMPAGRDMITLHFDSVEERVKIIDTSASFMDKLKNAGVAIK